MATAPDVLILLDRLLATTPTSVYACRPLPRSTIVTIANEIRTLRRALRASVPTAEQADAEAQHETGD